MTKDSLKILGDLLYIQKFLNAQGAFDFPDDHTLALMDGGSFKHLGDLFYGLAEVADHLKAARHKIDVMNKNPMTKELNVRRLPFVPTAVVITPPVLPIPPAQKERAQTDPVVKRKKRKLSPELPSRSTHSLPLTPVVQPPEFFLDNGPFLDMTRSASFTNLFPPPTESALPSIPEYRRPTVGRKVPRLHTTPDPALDASRELFG